VTQKSHQKYVKSILPEVRCIAPTLSGFKKLKALSILDMDTHEYMEELRACIHASSPTLNTLRLSFSESFANKSRRPPIEIHSDDDSDQEDEFGQITPPPGVVDPNAPTNAFKAQEEKKKQESVLANILGWKAAPLKIKTTPTRKPETKEKKKEEDPQRRFIRTLAPVAAKLMSHVKPDGDYTAEQSELLAMIEKACKSYLDNTDRSKTSQPGSVGSSPTKGTPASSAASGDESTPGISVTDDGPGLFDEQKTKKKVLDREPGVSHPEDIDVDEPETEAEDDAGTETCIDESFAKSMIEVSQMEVPDKEAVEGGSSTSVLKTGSELNSESKLHGIHAVHSQGDLWASYNEIKLDGEGLKKKMDKLISEQAPGPPNAKYLAVLAQMDAGWSAIQQRLAALSRDLEKITGDISDPQRASMDNYANSESPRTEMSEYIRNTRGLTLSTLEIYLIPVRANVLSQRIDLHVLQSITLLSVGLQAPFWNIMAAENNISPLPLHKINTDNVTLQFLIFVSQLNNLTELIMLERTPKAKVDHAAAKATVTIEQIRKFALKKHVATLKILVIKNRSTLDWDLNIKTTMLLCQRAKHLEELACIYGTKIMVSNIFLTHMQFC